MIFNLALVLVLVAFCWLAWRNIFAALCLVVAVLPSYLIRLAFPVPGTGVVIPSTLLELLVLILVLIWAWQNKVFTKAGSRNLVWPNAFVSFRLPLVLFLLAATFSLIYSPLSNNAFGLWKAYFFEPVFFFLILINVVRRREEILGVITSAAIGASGLSLVAIYQKFSGWHVPEPWTGLAVRRVTSFFEYPNALALYLVPLVVIFIGLLLYRQKLALNKWQTLVLGLAVLTGLPAIIFTKSEGAMLGLVIAVIFLAIAHPKRKILIPGLVVLGAIASAVIFSRPEWRSSFWLAATWQENSSQVRLALWYGTLRLLAAHPILGSGLAGFPALYDQYRLARHTELLLYPHNVFLNFWTEIGLLGLLAFLGLLKEFFSLVRKIFRQEKFSPTGVISLSLAAGMIALLVHGLVDVPYFKNDLSVEFWLIIGLLLATSQMATGDARYNLRAAKTDAIVT